VTALYSLIIRERARDASEEEVHPNRREETGQKGREHGLKARW
jgi:hypothetical protein